MAKIVWDADGQRLYETGTKNGVLYPKNTNGAYGTGVGWNGLTGVTLSPSGAEETALYANDRKYLSLFSAEELGLTITAYTYPDEFAACDGSTSIATGVTVGQQNRKGFGFCYRTAIGNDNDGDTHGYKLRLIYNCMASPSEKAYQTINDSPEAVEFSWEVKTTPLTIANSEGTLMADKPSAMIEIDSTLVDGTKLTALEAILYGTDGEGSSTGTEPRLPLPAEIIQMMS